MPRSDWRVFGAVVGIVLASLFAGLSLQPQKPDLTGNAGYEKQEGAYRAGGPDCQPASVNALAVRQRTERAIACKEAEEEHRLKANDLIQQRRAADAAEASAIFSFQQTRIGSWGVALGLTTMAAAIAAAFYARDAANHTRRGADASEKSVAETQRIGEAQTRCYLSVIEARVRLRGNVPVLQVKVRNSGQSPVRNLCASYGFTPDIGSKFDMAELQMMDHEAVEDIAAQDATWLPVWHPPKLLTAQDIKNWGRPSSTVMAFKAALRGVDVFGKKIEEFGYFILMCTGVGDGEDHPMSTFNAAKADAKARLLQIEFDEFRNLGPQQKN